MARYKIRNELHRYTTEYAKRLLHFSLSLSLSLSFFYIFFLLPVAPRRCRDVAGWLAAHINKIVATFANVSRWLITSGNEVDARTEDYGN